MVVKGNRLFTGCPRSGLFGSPLITVAFMALFLLPKHLAARKDAKDTLLQVEAAVDLGKDYGQNFGSLFEARDKKGRLVCGAGFAGAYNTAFRSDRHTIQFFIRPEEDDRQVNLEPLPRPSTDSGVYMFDLDGKLYARSHAFDKTVRSWNQAAKHWQDELDFGGDKMRVGDGRMRVAGRILHFANSRATYDEKPLLSPPNKGYYHHFYYAAGHLFFYHRYDASDGFSKLHACPWTVESGRPIDIEKARSLDLTFAGETPFVFGQLNHRVVTCSNLGGVYVFDGTQWKTLRQPDRKVSFQIYSSVNYYDRLLLGQYPTGFLFEFDGERLKLWNDSPPVLSGVSKSAREAQTAMIYRGDLYAGVWPWAELWRHNNDFHRWITMGRAFTHPSLTDKFTHPYENETKSLFATTGTNGVLNGWGQRITSLVPLGDSLMVATSSKGPEKKESRPPFIDEEKWKEYGQVTRMRLKGNLAAAFHWKDQRTNLQFIVTRETMTIRQDGVELATAKVAPDLTERLNSSDITWGQGVFGPFQGNIQGKRVKR